VTIEEDEPPDSDENGGDALLQMFSVRNPWAYLLLSGEKKIENRVRRLPLNLCGEWMALQVSKTLTLTERRYIDQFCPEITAEELEEMSGCIIGMYNVPNYIIYSGTSSPILRGHVPREIESKFCVGVFLGASVWCAWVCV